MFHNNKSIWEKKIHFFPFFLFQITQLNIYSLFINIKKYNNKKF